MAGAPLLMPDLSVILLAGGSSTRFGGDKLAADVGGSPLLIRVAHGLRGWPVVAVGPRRELGPGAPTDLTWVTEDPPGGGPMAGIAAGLPSIATDLAAILAGDMPAGASALPALATAMRDAPPTVDAAVARDPAGVRNPLLAVYRTSALNGAIPSDPHGRPARLLLELNHVAIDVDARTAWDIDAPGDLAGPGREADTVD